MERFTYEVEIVARGMDHFVPFVNDGAGIAGRLPNVHDGVSGQIRKVAVLENLRTRSVWEKQLRWASSPRAIEQGTVPFPATPQGSCQGR